MSDDNSGRAIAAAEQMGLAHTVTRHGRVGSLEEAAAARGVEPRAVVKTIVVRLADDDYRFVLVPGDREIAWPKLRALLGVNRISMPSADVAFEATGYVRGTITPLGSRHPWPVVADEGLQPHGRRRHQEGEDQQHVGGPPRGTQRRHQPLLTAAGDARPGRRRRSPPRCRTRPRGSRAGR